MTAGLLEMFSNTDWGKRLKEEKDKALSSAIMSLFNPDFKVPISTQTDITPTFQSNVDQFKTQPSGAGLGFLNASILKSLFQPLNEEERKKSYKQAALTMIGSALGGALAKALGASDEFAAGMAGGGYLMGQKLLEEQLEKEKAWQNFRNKLATKLVTANIDYAAERAKDEAKRSKLKAYSSLLREIYPKYCSDDGSFDWIGFSHEATIRALELGLDPKETKELHDSFFYATKTLAEINKLKALIIEALAKAGWYQEKQGTEKTEQKKNLAQAKKTEKETELLDKPKKSEVIYKYEGLPHKGGIDIQKLKRKYLEKAIQQAMKDPEWETATNERKKELIRKYWEPYQLMLEDFFETQVQLPTGGFNPVTAEELYIKAKKQGVK